MTDGKAMYKVTFRQRSMHQTSTSSNENGEREGTDGVACMDLGCSTIEGEFGCVLNAPDLLSDLGGGDDPV